jgi:hypothetical protein
MKDLQTVLRRFKSPITAGGAVGVAQPINVDALRQDLGLVVGKSDKLLWVCIVCLLVLFLIDIVILFHYLTQPGMIAAVVGATGVGFPVILNFMQRLWKQKFATQTIVAILPSLSQADLPAIIDKLLAAL